jgi:sugar phosphate isomerase/epimerase
MDFNVGIMWWSYHRMFQSNWAASGESFIRRVGEIGRKYGFAPMGIEFGTCQLERRDKAYVTQIKSLMDKYDLMPVLRMNRNFQVHADREVAEASLQQLIEELQIAHWLGAKIGVFSGQMHGRVSREGQIRIWSDMAGRLADAAQKLGIQVCEENYAGFSADEIERAMKLANRPNLGTLNDIGNYVITGDHPLKATIQLRPWIIYAHIKDYRYVDGIWRSVVLGEGILDIPAILRVLRDDPGPGPLMLCMETDLDSGDEDAAADASAAYLRDVLDSL